MLDSKVRRFSCIVVTFLLKLSPKCSLTFRFYLPRLTDFVIIDRKGAIFLLLNTSSIGLGSAD